MPTLPTWAGRSNFSYNGNVNTGTVISFGSGNKITLSASQYTNLIKAFKGTGNFPVGTSFDNPPANSLGAWLQAKVTKTAIASYVAPILINEGIATRQNTTYISIP